MQVAGLDERSLGREEIGTSFVVFFYEGGDGPSRSWSVDSFLLTECDLTEVLSWLSEHVPRQACYSVGVVFDPPRPTAESEVDVAWVLGADLLNTEPRHWTATEERIARGMLARRGRVALT